MLKTTKLNDYMKFKRSNERLYEIIRKQRPPIDKTRLGYDNITKPIVREDEGKSRIYANSLRGEKNKRKGV